MEREQIYSPTQAGFGALFGPIAASYFLWKNFQTLGKPAEAKQAVLWGVLINTSGIVFMPYLTSITPMIIILLCYALTVRVIVEKLQITEKQATESSQYLFQSNIRVLLIGFGGVIINLVLALLVYFIENLASRYFLSDAP